MAVFALVGRRKRRPFEHLTTWTAANQESETAWLGTNHREPDWRLNGKAGMHRAVDAAIGGLVQMLPAGETCSSCIDNGTKLAWCSILSLCSALPLPVSIVEGQTEPVHPLFKCAPFTSLLLSDQGSFLWLSILLRSLSHHNMFHRSSHYCRCLSGDFYTPDHPVSLYCIGRLQNVSAEGESNFSNQISNMRHLRIHRSTL